MLPFELKNRELVGFGVEGREVDVGGYLAIEAEFQVAGMSLPPRTCVEFLEFANPSGFPIVGNTEPVTLVPRAQVREKKLKRVYIKPIDWKDECFRGGLDDRCPTRFTS